MAEQPRASLLRSQFQQAHAMLEATMEGVTEEVAHRTPGGVAQPIGATYTHVVQTEDILVNQVLKGAPMLMSTTYEGKTGASEPAPAPLTHRDDWAARVRVNMGELRAYARDVFANTEEALAGISDADLERTVDLTTAGLGELTLTQLMSTVLLNCYVHTGEISCMKGLQGMKGYPV